MDRKLHAHDRVGTERFQAGRRMRARPSRSQSRTPRADNCKAAFIVNRKVMNSVLGRDILWALAHFELPILSAHLCQRVLYAESASRGLAVVEAGQRSEAACEVAALISTILRLVTEPSSSDQALAAA